MKLDLQPFTLLPPPQVFLAENLHNPSSKNRAFARFLGRTYEALHNERSLAMPVPPYTKPRSKRFCSEHQLRTDDNACAGL